MEEAKKQASMQEEDIQIRIRTTYGNSSENLKGFSYQLIGVNYDGTETVIMDIPADGQEITESVWRVSQNEFYSYEYHSVKGFKDGYETTHGGLSLDYDDAVENGMDFRLIARLSETYDITVRVAPKNATTGKSITELASARLNNSQFAYYVEVPEIGSQTVAISKSVNSVAANVYAPGYNYGSAGTLNLTEGGIYTLNPSLEPRTTGSEVVEFYAGVDGILDEGNDFKTGDVVQEELEFRLLDPVIIANNIQDFKFTGVGYCSFFGVIGRKYYRGDLLARFVRTY